MNVFRGISSNPWFLGVIFTTVVTQFCLVTFGGGFTKTCPLSAREWMLTTAIGALSLPIGVIMRFMPVPWEDDSEKYDGGNADGTKTMNAPADAPADDQAEKVSPSKASKKSKSKAKKAKGGAASADAAAAAADADAASVPVAHTTSPRFSPRLRQRPARPPRRAGGGGGGDGSPKQGGH